MRRHGLLPSPDDVYVSSSQVRRFGLRDRRPRLRRRPRAARGREVLGPAPRRLGQRRRQRHRPPRPRFSDLTPVHPDVLINLESDPKNLSQRLVNLVNPIGKGQRALIVSPPKAGKTMLLKNIANGISAQLPGDPPHGRAHRRAPAPIRGGFQAFVWRDRCGYGITPELAQRIDQLLQEDNRSTVGTSCD